jgi:hypothetical protein
MVRRRSSTAGGVPGHARHHSQAGRGDEEEGNVAFEIVAKKPTAQFDAKYGDFVIDPAFFTLLVYMGV